MKVATAGIIAICWLCQAGVASAQVPEPFWPFEARAYRLVNSIAFSPSGSEMYFALFAREVRAHRGESSEGVPEVGLYRSTLGTSGWSEPEMVPITGGFHTYEPTISADGRTMVFNSTRPYSDGQVPEKNDLWVSERTNGEWGSPRRIAELSTFEAEESYGALADDGTLVFLKEIQTPDGSPGYDLYESHYSGGRFSPPTRHPVSTNRWGEGDPWISPDGRTLIFTRWDDEIGWAESVDLYIATLDPDGWSEPVPLRELNTDGADFGVASSPDGRWLYYKTNSQFMRVDMESVLGRYRDPGPPDVERTSR